MGECAHAPRRITSEIALPITSSTSIPEHSALRIIHAGSGASALERWHGRFAVTAKTKTQSRQLGLLIFRRNNIVKFTRIQRAFFAKDDGYGQF
jgi:hypothetical protein